MCRATGVQRHRCVGVQVGRSAGAQGCKGARVPGSFCPLFYF